MIDTYDSNGNLLPEKYSYVHSSASKQQCSFKGKIARAKMLDYLIAVINKNKELVGRSHYFKKKASHEIRGKHFNISHNKRNLLIFVFDLKDEICLLNALSVPVKEESLEWIDIFTCIYKDSIL